MIDDDAGYSTENLSRSGFLRWGAAAGAGLTAAGLSAAGAPGAEAAPPASPAPTTPAPATPAPAAEPSVENLGPITGRGITTRFQMERTDLGIPARTPDGRVLCVFGDSYNDEDGVNAPENDWRSPTGLYAEDVQPTETIEWTGAVGGERAEQLAPYDHVGGKYTVLPADVITLGDTMHLWVMRNDPYPDVVGTEIWTSHDSGATWEATPLFAADLHGGTMQLATWALHPEDGHVYALTSGFQRNKPAYLLRVPVEQILSPDAYETWGFADGEWAWGNDPTPVLDGSFGEMCWRVMEDGSWLLTWFDAGHYTIEALLADGPTANLHDAPRTTLVHGADWGNEGPDRIAQLYGGYQVPGSTPQSMHLVVSQWNTATQHPYRSMLVRADGAF